MSLRHIRARAPTEDDGALVNFRSHQCKGEITMMRASRWSGLALGAISLLTGAGTTLYGQVQTQKEALRPARSRAEETLDRWNDVGKKLVTMAQDFPEDKYDFRLEKDERTFAENS